MTQKGAKKVYENVLKNMKKSFKTIKSLEKGLKVTKTYQNSKDEIVTKIAFYGYDEDKKTKKYPNGIPISLIASAREYGSISGEAKKPFFRKSFNKKEIEEIMKNEIEKFLPKE